MGQGHQRAAHKVAEARMARANKAPHDAQDDEDADDIAAPHMQGVRAAGFVFGTEIRHNESRDERPMPETHQRIPYKGACRPAFCPDRFAAAHP